MADGTRGVGWKRQALQVALGVVLLVALGVPQAVSKDAPSAKRAESLLADGKAAEALELAYELLAVQAEDVALLDLASRAAEAAERKDEALWLARLAAHTALAQDVSGPEQRRLVGRSGTLDPLPAAERPPMEGYGSRLLELGRLCVKRRLYANAVDFLARCEATPAAPEAAEQLEDLYGKKRAVEAMLTTGLDVPLPPSHRKSPERIAKEDKRHATWKKAWKIKGDNYTVQTNAGYELGSAVLDAMEQINRHYRTVFQHKQRGGGTARCTIRLYATRAEFEEHEDERDPTTQGFYSSDNYVACYDPRSTGGRLSELWETVFHEAAHQFTHMISTGTIPGWLDEGTAVYFEGTRRQANGRVETNLVHEERLRHLKEVLDKGVPTLKEVVSYFGDESYPLDYYPVGGYLVYFFKNYEDDDCERVYAPLFDAYLRSYKSGGKHDPFERFVEYFVKKAKQPGIDSFEALAERFKAWILALHDLQFGPPERADLLLARAARQREAGKLAAALDSYRWALNKRVNDPRALRGLAELHHELDEEDAALYRWRQLHDVATRAADRDAPLPGTSDFTAAQALTLATTAIAAIDRLLATSIEEGDHAFVEQVQTAAARYAEAGYPRVAIWTLDRAAGALAGHPGLAERRRALRAEHGVGARLWRRVPLDAEAWQHGEAWSFGADGLRGRGDGSHALDCLLARIPPVRYGFQVTIDIARVTGEDPFVGVLFGVDEGAVWDVFGVDDGGAVDVSRAAEDWRVLKTLPPLKGDPLEPFTLGIEVDRGQVQFFIDGKPVHGRAYAPGDLRGRVGLLVQDVEARFTDLRIAH